MVLVQTPPLGAGLRIGEPVASFYETLEVSPRASSLVIRAAYRCPVQHHHPDKNPRAGGADQRLVPINEACAAMWPLTTTRRTAGLGRLRRDPAGRLMKLVALKQPPSRRPTRFTNASSGAAGRGPCHLSVGPDSGRESVGTGRATRWLRATESAKQSSQSKRTRHLRHRRQWT